MALRVVWTGLCIPKATVVKYIFNSFNGYVIANFPFRIYQFLNLFHATYTEVQLLRMSQNFQRIIYFSNYVCKYGRNCHYAAGTYPYMWGMNFTLYNYRNIVLHSIIVRITFIGGQMLKLILDIRAHEIIN